MLITRLRIAGFKSFVDPVEAPIEPGLTGVVGPNGCGKSNILEAVRWAMGAASAKALRADDMDSVIFSGSAARPARESAEVTLVVEGALGQTQEISRRIRRDHGSSYRINGREARAKDVQLLFADASTGANSPALVRQGQVSELITARPENRRRVLEEAAGIAGLHARRHEADLKLAGALANLARLDDIVADIEAQGAHLRRQARQAARLKALALELRKVEALLHARRIAAADTVLADREGAQLLAVSQQGETLRAESEAERASAACADALAPLREADMIADALTRQAQADLQTVNRDQAEALATLQRLKDLIAATEADIARETARQKDARESLAQLLVERTQIETHAPADQLTELRANAASLRAAAVSADAAWRQLAAAAMAADAQRASAKHRLAEVETQARALEARAAATAEKLAQATAVTPDLAPLEADVEKAEAALVVAETDANSHAQSVESARVAAADAEAAARALQATLAATRADLAALEDALARAPTTPLAGLRAAPGFERALAAAFVDSEACVWTAVETHDAPQWPAQVTPLGHHATAPDALALRLKFTGVVAPGADGAALQVHLAPGAQLVDHSGQVWRWDGASRSAPKSDDAHALRLTRQNAQASLLANQGDLERDHAAAHAAAHTTREALNGLRTRDARLREAAHAARSALAAAQSAHTQARKSAATALATAEALRAEIAAIAAARSDSIQSLEAARAALQACPASDPDRVARAQQDADGARTSAAAADAQVTLAQNALEARTARLHAIAREDSAWRLRLNDADARLANLKRQHTDHQRAYAEASLAPETFDNAIAAARARLEQSEQRLRDARDALATGEARARDANQALRAAQAAHAAAREARASADVHAEAARQRLQDLIDAAQAALGLAPEALPAAVGDLVGSALAGGPISEIERRYDRMRAERDAAGPVNLQADEELLQIEERVGALHRERADVAAAVATLKGAITRLNTEARSRLDAAMSAINAHFAVLFATLFEGGEARLGLTEAEDPLACGLEIFASPPGKKLTTLSLMSGGEQALTATALIFAVFMANPAPLCVLDEVDAPLDDANVERFCRMLERMRDATATRFLVITHNPITMSRMDRLLGVTMADAGVSQIVSVDLAAAKVLAA